MAQMSGRLSMNSKRNILGGHKPGILKQSASSSSIRGGTPGRNRRKKRAVSFSEVLERVHLFDPNQTFRPGRGHSVEFRISIGRKTAGAGSSPSGNKNNLSVSPVSQAR